MIINKIHINSFGKLKDFDIEFDSGMNVVYGRNESGKSTLQTFIKGIFYTLSGGSGDIGKNERKKYQPWDGSPMSGTLTFTDDGQKYEISKVFLATAGKDKAAVTDAVTGRPNEKIPPKLIGETVFGFGEEAFKNTMFVKQSESFFSRSKEDELITKLINLSQTGSENVSYKRACDYIESYRKIVCGTTRTKGEIELLGLKITELMSELDRAKTINKELAMAGVRLTALAKKREKQKEDLERLGRQRALLRLGIQYQEYEAAKMQLEKIKARMIEIQELKKETETAEALLVKELGADDSLFTTDTEIALIMNEKRVSEINEELNHIEEIKKEIAKLKTQIEEALPKNKVSAVIPAVAIALSAFMAVLAFIIKGTLGAIIGVSGFIPLLGGMILFIRSVMRGAQDKNGNVHLKTRIAELEQKLSQKDEALLIREKNECASYNRSVLEAALCQDVSAFSEKRKACISKKQTVFEYSAKLEVYEAEIKRLSEEYQAKAESLRAAYGGKEPGKPQDAAAFATEEEFDAAFDALNLEIIGTEKESKDIENILKTGLLGIKPVSLIEEEIDSAKTKLSEAENKKKMADTALEVLKQSFSQLQRDFGPVLNKEVEEILSQVSDGAYQNIRVSENYEISVLSPDTNMYHDSKYLSAGALDMAYLSLRLGILNVIFDGRAPFLILDDSFSLYDDKRCEAAIRVLHKLSSNCQIILLTCQKRDTIICERIGGIKVIDI